MARRVVSIVFYVVAGFLVYTVDLLAFTDMSSMPGTTKPPAWAKFAMMGAFSAPVAVALLLGLAINRFRHWKRDVGIVLVSGGRYNCICCVDCGVPSLVARLQEVISSRHVEFFRRIRHRTELHPGAYSDRRGPYQDFKSERTGTCALTDLQ
jgi:hypothetical protein